MRSTANTASIAATGGEAEYRQFPRLLLLGALVAYLILHIMAISIAGTAAMRVSYVFEIIPPLLVTVFCLRRAKYCTGISCIQWRFVAGAFIFWLAGLLVTMLQEAFLVGRDTMSLTGDFIFFVYGVPVLVALSLTGSDRGSRSVLALDALQSIMAAVLAYFVLFNVFPPAHNGHTTISPLFLILVYDCENVFLLLATALPLLASPQGEEKTFHTILTTYFVVYTGVVGICNHLSIAWDLSTGTSIDVLSNIPLLLFIFLITTIPIREANRTARSLGSTALFARNASPIFFTLAVLTLGAFLTTHEPLVGITAIALSLLTYCFRATILQTNYFRMQLALHEANGKLEYLSLCDPLTGIHNRRGFEHALALACESAERTGEPLCLLMLDIDYFKLLNDRYGHVYGDECLVRIASELESNLNRSHDTLARYGGEEFAVVLPRTDIENAIRVADRLRNAVLELFIQNDSAIGHFVSLSAGAASYLALSRRTPQALVQKADSALYRAKHLGRNRTETVEEEAASQSVLATPPYLARSSSEPMA